MTWGVAGSDDLPPGTSTVTFELTATDGGTRVDLIHADLPATGVAGHVDGWTHFLPRLQAASMGHHPGMDSWTPLTDRRNPTEGAR